MLDKRLLALVPDALRHVIATVVCQWLGLAATVAATVALSRLLADLLAGTSPQLVPLACAVAAAAATRAAATRAAEAQSFASAGAAQATLRHQVLAKVMRLGPAYAAHVPTAEVVQLAVEGCEQLETYFARYLPQLFFAVLAPVSLFAVLAPLCLPAAATLLACVPLIPAVIVIVQKIAKRILGSYWGEYANLADTFLENLQGLATLKIYQADAARHERMDEQAERFRRATMRVLRMQLNSIIVMDLGVLGGAVAGIVVALGQLQAGSADAFSALLVSLLAVEFFAPMRRLGSYFHVAMNGAAAADRVFALLELPEPPERPGSASAGDHLSLHDVTFAWEPGRPVLHGVSLDVAAVGVTAIVGASGSGKSTVAALLCGGADDYDGDVLLGGKQLRDISRERLSAYVTYVPTSAFLFAGTVRDNLELAAPRAGARQMWDVLEAVALADWLRGREGLETRVGTGGEDLSGGQRQRLALARALLHNSPVYVLDEATSNVDVETEEAMLRTVAGIARYKAVVLISHRLANVVGAVRIYVMDEGRVAGAGTHEELLADCEVYQRLWEAQRELERYGRGGHA